MNIKPLNLYDGPVIDAHHHFWDPIKNDHPWLKPDVLIPLDMVIIQPLRENIIQKIILQMW